MPERSFTVKQEHYGSEVLFLLTGDLDFATAPALIRAVFGALGSQARCLLLDLSEVPFLDSTGAQALLRIEHWALTRGSVVILLHPTAIVRCRLERIGLHQVMQIVTTGKRAPSRER